MDPSELLIRMFSNAFNGFKNGYFSFSFTLKKNSRNSVIYYGRRQRKISENEGPAADS